MKADLYVMGVYKGEIEVGENSIVGLLASGRVGEAGGKVKAMQDELSALCEEREEEGNADD